MIRPFLAALAATLLILPAAAPAADTDYSDLWWNAAESGWGVGIQRQGDVLFVTLFVYGADGSNTWFVAPDVQPIPATPDRWQGALYRATGPAFSAAYDNAAQATQAGTATIDFAGPSSATLRYTVDGATITKQITRMTWREPSAAGAYHGGFSSVVTSCGDATRVGAYDFLGAMAATQSGRQLTTVVTTGGTGGPSRCTFTGNVEYSGRLASWTGTFNCTIYIGLDGRGEAAATTLRSGGFSVRELAISSSGVYGKLTAADQDCAFSGYFGGTRTP